MTEIQPPDQQLVDTVCRSLNPDWHQLADWRRDLERARARTVLTGAIANGWTPPTEVPASMLPGPRPTFDDAEPIRPIQSGHDNRQPITPRTGWISSGNAEPGHVCGVPDQYSAGALWACREGHLWQCLDDCDACRANGGRPHGGVETLGLAWFPGTWWQRRTYGPGLRRARLAWAGPNRRQNRIKSAGRIEDMPSPYPKENR